MTDLPIDFIARTKPLLKTDWDKFVAALTANPPTSIRLNKVKSNNYKPDTENILWCDAGYYLNKRPQFTFDPLFHAGCYYVQEASSMFIGQALRQYISDDVKVLDLCAAPGGKSTLIADLISENSLLVSNEVIRSRAHILSENITKWGKPNTIVTNNDPAQIGKLNNFFDIILVDAPCSGEGMFRKDEGAISEWSVDNVKLCKERQQRILADIWPALKPGGLLLYSTCTYNMEENEQNVQWIRDELQAEVLPVAIKDEWDISPSFADDIHAYRFFPHKTKGEGFFFALLRKTGTEQEDSISFKKSKNNKDQKTKVKLDTQYRDYIRDKDNYTFYQKGEAWHAFPSVLHNDLLMVQSRLNTISEGVCLGEFKGKDFIPSQSLAMSNSLNIKAFNSTVIDWHTAISYLRKEALTLTDQPKGYILLTYNNIPLGFVKNIGNRANNLYPQEWRIRSANVPEEIVEVLR
ncbi:16S rRNA C967 or C1407 C5-methylase (RsmB/RsmF family)/NOL1/NOP2/fmu family ribosome biogenesis protein [Dysgonomonas sp. PFB1-18]|uniref:methyltransferase RsmF C-terminal domain-like protein n=1 Tax=unclassified Dysgonomonas TaxID=2630389 RepID=UPI00247422E8|nr:MULTISPECIES: rRNA cytosine-C5-methyltransferase [unclassified Dysgonomonas]MDH6309744.1 16S rRNA C967 or C1407 C5-methylase (RsmB/RsmF family)/NOL1/NOP2/fmu family ribosome biogenesis protein [Dysgonomonas sp. PF1-14]MDH6339248.1 16S rRNA C967 or C1407 C5-methylase (RsmB/RsmF family)/NOL1/NOP2/fmu family ribosome biogenesis protein [Dysgonomonas sp. PF1-16]MDH6380747.1 16S rRNA C967 or C1407 C5-methylase (RsmB/RsmF family)/NOL1/NOP2/fmu family ribosome biogenesis protein [Dysgonomonas sp. PF